MFCPKCGTQNTETTQKCLNCGYVFFAPEKVISKSATTFTQLSTKQKKIGSIISSAVGILSGLSSMILGFITKGYSSGSYEIASSYGGDAYTGIQNAAAQTANNVIALTKIIKFGVSSLLIVIGIAIICFFTIKLLDYMRKEC
ncbi:MAG: hypothetical protein IJC74_09715 [Clostridia bacterium]|nr:hypothetical protein [Clostridia bacterium]